MTSLPPRESSPRPACSIVFYALLTLVTLASLLVTTGHAGATPPAVGDRYVYRLTDGYNPEIRGQLSQRVENIEGGRITLAVSRATGCATPSPVATSHLITISHRLIPPTPCRLSQAKNGQSASMLTCRRLASNAVCA